MTWPDPDNWPSTAEFVAASLAVPPGFPGCTCGENEATNPDDRTQVLPHHFDCDTLAAWRIAAPFCTSDVEDWAREEQEDLWGDLSLAIHAAANGVWSLACWDLAIRLIKVARLVGPTDPVDVGIPLLVGGVYEDILVGGVYEDILTVGSVPLPENLDTVREEHLYPTTVIRYAATRNAIQRESLSILQEVNGHV